MSKSAVIHIITKLELGGAQEIALYIVKNLDRERYDVSLISGPKDILTADVAAIAGVEFFEVPELVREVSPLKDFRALLRLRAILLSKVGNSSGGVIVHTHSSKAGILGRWAAWLAGVPVIIHTIHGYGFNDEQGRLSHGFFVWLERLTSWVTTRFIAVAHDNIKKGMLCGILKEKDALVLRAGINIGHFGASSTSLAEKRAELGLPADAPVATMVSCLKPQKAPVDFVRVAAKVLKKLPDAHFVQAGDGELRGEVLFEAERLGISDRFHLLGWRRDVREIMHMSDVIVLTSLWEGLPKVIPQAMAAGKPVVATAVDGTPEAVRDGVSGFLAMPHDVDLIAEKVALLLGDRDLAAKMGRAGRERVSEFDEVRMLNDLCALYERLLEEAA